VRTSTSAKPNAPLDAGALPAWVGETGWDADVVLSTRARLARNLAALPFPGHASQDELKAVAKQILPVARQREKGQAALRAVEVDKLSETDKARLVDSHLISPQHAGAGPYRWALVDDRHTISVMVNEEDHLRLQAILPGLQLESAWRIADKLDDLFGAQLEYAKHDRYGFLTASLSNCGTGLRMSVMVHLPGLALAGKLEEKLGAARTLGASVRGLYGEASGAVGDVYQISNAVSIGLSERQISARLAAVTTFLSTDEQATRELLRRRERSKIEAQVADAQAQLKAAERLSAKEAMSILSILRLGGLMELPTGVSTQVFSELLTGMRIGAQYVSGEKAQYTFFEETRRPALIRNKIRERVAKTKHDSK
jgi:protein arginine kinase